MKRSISGVVIVFAAISAGTLHAAVPCDSLKGFAMKNVTVTMALAVGAGEFTPPPPPARGAAAAAPAAAEDDGTPAVAAPARGGAAPGRGGAPPVSYRDLPAFCRVAATLTPVPDSEIKIEVWLPVAGWNGNR